MMNKSGRRWLMRAIVGCLMLAMFMIVSAVASAADVGRCAKQAVAVWPLTPDSPEVQACVNVVKAEQLKLKQVPSDPVEREAWIAKRQEIFLAGGEFWPENEKPVIEVPSPPISKVKLGLLIFGTVGIALSGGTYALK